MQNYQRISQDEKEQEQIVILSNETPRDRKLQNISINKPFKKLEKD